GDGEAAVGAAAGAERIARVLGPTTRLVALGDELREGPLDHRELQLVDVPEMPVNRRRGDAQPSCQPAQREAVCAPGFGDRFSGGVDQILAKAIALSSRVAWPDVLGRGRRPHLT